MMAKTHIAVGIAAGLAASCPAAVGEYFTALIGGAAGGMMCDIDIADGHYKSDSRAGRNIVIRLCAGVLLLDMIFHTGIWEYIIHRDPGFLAAGAIMTALLTVWGMNSPHRGFTHSILAMFLFGTALSFIYPPMLRSFGAGYASHLVLDMLNKKGMRLFYPFKGSVCLGLCYADGRMNRLIMKAGIAASVILTVSTIINLG